MKNFDLGKKLGLKIGILRTGKRWSQDDLAKKVGVKKASIQRWEDGSTAVKLENFVSIAVALQVSAVDLLAEILNIPIPNDTASQDFIHTYSTLSNEEKAQVQKYVAFLKYSRAN